MSLPPHQDFQRLQHLHKQAHDTLVAAHNHVIEQQRAIAKDATGQFEKIAGFCGAAIVVVVSFLGGHKDFHLRWHILIPASIWILVGGMIAATARNIIYQHWAHRSYERSERQAQRDEQAARIACIEVAPNAVALQSGERFDKNQLSRMKQATGEVDAILATWEKKEKVLLNCWIFMGKLAQLLAVAGIICLAALATKNV